jgi:hypothetical protein
VYGLASSLHVFVTLVPVLTRTAYIDASTPQIPRRPPRTTDRAVAASVARGLPYYGAPTLG